LPSYIYINLPPDTVDRYRQPTEIPSLIACSPCRAPCDAFRLPKAPVPQPRAAAPPCHTTCILHPLVETTKYRPETAVGPPASQNSRLYGR